MLPSRLTEALERAQKHWQKRRQEEAAAPVALTIAIAREAGCPGTSVAREVGARLGWPVYDHELLQIIAEEMGLRVNLLESIDERRQSWILENLATFGEAKFVSESSYVRHLVQTILSLGSHGQCIIVGRGAAQLLPPEPTLRVRLIGRRQDRVTALAARLGIPPTDAQRKVDEIDRERVRFVTDHFQKDPRDVLQYDLLLNTSRWSVSDCADLIVHALHDLQTGLAGKGRT